MVAIWMPIIISFINDIYTKYLNKVTNIIIQLVFSFFVQMVNVSKWIGKWIRQKHYE